ncbi:LysE family translocator [Microbulbifer hainanensis]|uniref:LysE family translocator n=1 Tax=Microbulbifer hainanensis TaxID=2735675 RepID=UPI001867592C|nr:LysE family translocator [Microbulbifer hainanensis]
MDILQVLTFALIVTLLVISPGPNGVLIAKTVPISGRAAGFANIWGFVAAFYIHGTLSILGISVLLVQSSEAFFAFKLLGAAYLCWIGCKSLLTAWKNEQPIPKTPERLPKKAKSIWGAFIEGFFTNVLNPKVSMFYLAAFPQFMPHGESILASFTLVSIHALINLLWFSALVLLLSKLKGMANSASYLRWLKSVTGAVFIGFGTKLAFLKPLNNG